MSPFRIIDIPDQYYYGYRFGFSFVNKRRVRKNLEEVVRKHCENNLIQNSSFKLQTGNRTNRQWIVPSMSSQSIE